ncbi:FadR/GntR family transcriptional regulator [Oceaniglobus ichthyenteri]|uniref:FadR/GntR family transcriptional regulator n=1 Tax=Oceaniglobus ichthyenteri TaxID=2136177 RepID=UPI000D35E296|nr:FCD domain-containing protein [Oceaniglobus ichthyenteri]
MPFEKIQPEKLSHAVVRQIELLILRGILHPGERLPSERDLAEKLGVSRPSLREALAQLQQQGLIASRASAGIFVSQDLSATFPPALARLFHSHPEAVFDYLAFRRDIEGLAAERAARLGTDTDLRLIDSTLTKMEAAHAQAHSETEAQLDAAFHLAIIEASHNTVMLHMMRSMSDLLRQGVFYNRQVMFKQRTTREMLLDQHRAIHAALMARAPSAARDAMETHIDFIATALSNQIKAEQNESVARQRLKHEQTP